MNNISFLDKDYKYLGFFNEAIHCKSLKSVYQPQRCYSILLMPINNNGEKSNSLGGMLISSTDKMKDRTT